MHEKGLEKICKFAVRSIRLVDFDSNDSRLTTGEQFSMNLLREAMQSMLQRPAYFNHCIDELSSQRRVFIVNNFLSALTATSADGKPVELISRDPVRFVSDMLAWIHQAVAGEKEVAYSLLKSRDVQDSSGKFSVDVEKAFQNHLEKSFDALCRPLQTRVEQILGNSNLCKESVPLGFVGAYQIFNLFQFYRTAILKFLSDQCSFMTILQRLGDAAMKRCYELIQSEGALLESIPGPSSFPQMDLAPPPALMEYIAQATQLLTAHETVMIQQSNEDLKEASPNNDPSLLISAVLEPIFKTVDILCDVCNFNPSESSVLHINVLISVQQALRKFPFTSSRMEILALDIHTNLSILIEDQISELLLKFGVAGKLKKLHEHSRQEEDRIALSETEGMDVTSLKLCMQQFYNSLIALGSLSGPSSSALPMCDRLLLQQLKLEARHGVSKGISSAYCELFDAINDPRNGYADPSAILQHSPEQFSSLLLQV